MTCPKCKSEQPDNSKFCSQCAEPLTAGTRKRNFVPLGVALCGLLIILFMISQQNSNRANTQNQALQLQMAQMNTPKPHFVPITNGAAAVPAGSYSWYTFVVPVGASTVAVNGHFSATGGTGNDIQCYILDEDGLVNFKNGHPATAYFNSGKVTQAKIGAVLITPGTYYLVMDNRFSLFTPKAVQIEATVSYMHQ
jgi:hypothetical protein